MQLALDYDPEVVSTDIGVAAADGTVTLTGFVETYLQKLAAERATKRTYGVKAIANDIHVKPTIRKTDTGIAMAAVNALVARVDVPDEKIQVTVKEGWVYLEGTVDWRYQRDAAEEAVRCLAGVIALDLPVLATSDRNFVPCPRGCAGAVPKSRVACRGLSAAP